MKQKKTIMLEIYETVETAKVMDVSSSKHN